MRGAAKVSVRFTHYCCHFTVHYRFTAFFMRCIGTDTRLSESVSHVRGGIRLDQHTPAAPLPSTPLSPATVRGAQAGQIHTHTRHDMAGTRAMRRKQARDTLVDERVRPARARCHSHSSSIHYHFCTSRSGNDLCSPTPGHTSTVRPATKLFKVHKR